MNIYAFNTQSGQLIEQLTEKAFLRKDSAGYFVVDYDRETVTEDHEWGDEAIAAWKTGECRSFGA